MKVLYLGYADMYNGIWLVAQGFDKVRSVLAKRPNLAHLNNVLAKFMPPMPVVPWQVGPPAAALTALTAGQSTAMSKDCPKITFAKVGDTKVALL